VAIPFVYTTIKRAMSEITSEANKHAKQLDSHTHTYTHTLTTVSIAV